MGQGMRVTVDAAMRARDVSRPRHGDADTGNDPGGKTGDGVRATGGGSAQGPGQVAEAGRAARSEPGGPGGNAETAESRRSEAHPAPEPGSRPSRSGQEAG